MSLWPFDNLTFLYLAKYLYCACSCFILQANISLNCWMIPYFNLLLLDTKYWNFILWIQFNLWYANFRGWGEIQFSSVQKFVDMLYVCVFTNIFFYFVLWYYGIHENVYTTNTKNTAIFFECIDVINTSSIVPYF